MKPDFALSLSFEGIALLRRGPKGWMVLGDVMLTSGTLSDDLAALRRKADALSPHGGQVKLVIPNEQIKFLTLPDTGADTDLGARIRKALDGATPYAVDDLVIDWSVRDGTVFVAAVARETLTEAEVFIAGHHFTPVCHVASAPDDQFDGEVFFGPATGWSGPAPERDGAAVRLFHGVAPADPPAEPAPARPPADPVGTQAEPPKTAAPEPDAVKAVSPQPAVPDTPEPSAPPAPVAFTSIRAHRKDADKDAGPAPRLDGATRAPSAVTPPPEHLAFRSKPETAAPPTDGAETAPKVKVTEGTIAADPAPESAGSRSRFGFLSRRKPDPAPKPVPAPAPAAPRAVPEPPRPVRTSALLARAQATPDAAATAVAAAPTERQRMTVFGQRDAQKIGGKPRFLGLALTTWLIVFLLGVAAWASIYVSDGVARLFRGADPQVVAQDGAAPVVVDDTNAETEVQADLETAEDTPATVELASLAVADDSVADDAPVEALAQPVPVPELTDEQIAATYAATGIWQRAPEAPALPATAPVQDVVAAGIDPVTASFDAIALAQPDAAGRDVSPGPQALPFPPGVRFRMDARGLVIASPEGTVSPEGAVVFAGRPAVVPPPRPAEAALLVENPDLLAERQRLRGLRPVLRPTNLTENAERAAFSGLNRAELAAFRPRLRPASLQQLAAPEPEATKLAIARSARPIPRPRDFASIVARAREAAPEPQETQVAAVTSPRNVQPDIPSSASVAKQATVRNALNLRRLNLIGVYGKSNDRRALIRLPNGRFQKVQVGDRLDGGRVAAIGEDALRYTKGGQTVTLEMP